MEETIEKYIAEAKAHGLSGEEIKKNLLTAGWDPGLVAKYEKELAVNKTAAPVTNPSVGASAPQGKAKPDTEPTKPQTDAQVLEVAKPGSSLGSSSHPDQPPHTTEPASPVPAKKPWYKRLKILLLILSGLIALIVIITLLFAYLIIGQGRNLLGYNIQDTMWNRFIDTEQNKLAERGVSMSYQDTGTFVFVPSKFIKEVVSGTELEEQVKYFEPDFPDWDKRFSFTLNNPGVSVDANGYINVQNIEKPDIDGYVSGSLKNNNLSYDARFDAKVAKTFAYGKYKVSDSVVELIKRAVDQPTELKEFTDKQDKWLKFNISEDATNDEDSPFTLNPLLPAQSKARDARRVADITQLRSALELYLNDEGRYPDNLNKLTPNYLGAIPKAPTPADGLCLDEYNNYLYTLKPKDTYSLTFCLGDKAGMYTKGNQELTQDGVKPYICPAGKTCTKTEPEEPEELKNLKQNMKENRFLSIEKFLGIETLNDSYTLHYGLALDKVKLKNVMLSYAKDFVGKENWEEKKEAREYTEKAIDTYLASFEVKNMEIWVGFDKEVYKFTYTLATPSVTGVAQMLYDETTKGVIKDALLAESTKYSSDSDNANQMRALKSALDNHKRDFGGYPGAINGRPNLSSNYYYEIPSAPSPQGRCTDFYNTYWYTPQGNGTTSAKDGSTVYPDYTYSFCLGTTQGEFSEGINILTPSGVKAFTACPAGRVCYKDLPPAKANPYTGKSDDEIIKDVYEKMTKKFLDLPKKGTITFNYEGKNFGKTKNIEEPKDFLDIGSKNRDARRLADIAQLRSALELYLNDEGRYPDSLSNLTPNYMMQIPSAPKPASGKCTDDQNKYKYTPVKFDQSVGSYKLTFCLGEPLGGYGAGVHTLTPSGIQ